MYSTLLTFIKVDIIELWSFNVFLNLSQIISPLFLSFQLSLLTLLFLFLVNLASILSLLRLLKKLNWFKQLSIVFFILLSRLNIFIFKKTQPFLSSLTTSKFYNFIWTLTMQCTIYRKEIPRELQIFPPSCWFLFLRLLLLWVFRLLYFIFNLSVNIFIRIN